MTNVSLPGLERLLAACGKYPVQAELRKPWEGAPTSSTLILDKPFDPILAAFCSRLGGLHLDLKLYVVPCDGQVNGILRANELESDWPEPFRSMPDFSEDRGTWPVFPWHVPEIIATDRELMGMIVEGRFDFLMFREGAAAQRGNEEIRNWIARLRAASP